MEAELDGQLTRLRAARSELAEKAEALRLSSAEAEADVRRRNLALDREEEA